LLRRRDDWPRLEKHLAGCSSNAFYEIDVLNQAQRDSSRPIASTERAAGCCAGKGARQRGLWQAHYEEIRAPRCRHLKRTMICGPSLDCADACTGRPESAVVIERGRLLAGRVPRRPNMSKLLRRNPATNGDDEIARPSLVSRLRVSPMEWDGKRSCVQGASDHQRQQRRQPRPTPHHC